ncbi:MAG TPA: 3D domain-containing protein [Pyrinomonadaceae bacterium]|nr:3D domain-containing protein [Pyrinomonadaceae bacterium]
MKLFVRGGVGLVAALFASSLIFNASPLSALTNPSQGPAQQQEQQQKKEPAGTTQLKGTEPQSAQSETTELAETVNNTPGTAVKDSNETAATTVKVDTTGVKSAPLTAPQTYVAFSYSWCCRGASGLGTRRGTIAADPRILPYGTRVRLEGMGSGYDGEYLVTDAGTAIKGNKIDVWVPTIHEARRFGRRNVKLTVLSYGGRKAKAKR